jgi:hypothetical protein
MAGDTKLSRLLARDAMILCSRDRASVAMSNARIAAEWIEAEGIKTF